MKTKMCIVVLIGMIVATNSFSQKLPSYIPQNGLVGYWSFDGNTKDLSGNGNDGEIINDVNGSLQFINNEKGVQNSAIEFSSIDKSWNAKSSYIKIPNTPSLSIINGYTINLFVKISKNNQTGELINKGPDNQNCFFSRMNGNKNILFGSIPKYLDKNIDDLNEEEATMFLSMMKALIKKDSRYKAGKRMEMESYSDYPDGVKNNAKRALEYANTKGWGSCGTPVGKQRANQLAKGEPISVDTIKRMYSFLSRHEGDLISSTAYGDGCGKLMYDAWGGKAGLGWSRNKLRTLGLLTETEANPSIPSSSYPGEIAKVKKKDLIVAPALIGDDRK